MAILDGRVWLTWRGFWALGVLSVSDQTAVHGDAFWMAGTKQISHSASGIDKGVLLTRQDF